MQSPIYDQTAGTDFHQVAHERWKENSAYKLSLHGGGFELGGVGE